jgi:hypothetical protein
MGVHPFGDPGIVDEFERVSVELDVRDLHEYAAEWTPAGVDFFVDGARVKRVRQSPAYPVQLMLGIYEFPEGAERAPGDYPKAFVVDAVRGYRLTDG